MVVKVPGSGCFKRLEGAARSIWEAVEYPADVDEVVSGLCLEYGGDPGQIAEDTASFLSQLLCCDLVAALEKEPGPEDRQRRRYLWLLKRSLVNLTYPEYELLIATVDHFSKEQNLVKRQEMVRDIRRLYSDRYRDLLDSKNCGNARVSFAHTMVGLQRLHNVERCAETLFAEGVDGDFLEAGVCRGGMAIFMRALQVSHGESQRNVWAADSFMGLPEPQDKVDLEAGMDLTVKKHPWLSVGVGDVKDHFRRYGLLDAHVHFLSGWFQESLGSAPIRQLALLRIDAD